jgi:hypothetical protein
LKSWRIRNVTWISTGPTCSGDRPISDVGDTFTMKMNRLGDDYLMFNYVVEFEPDRRIFWEPAPGRRYDYGTVTEDIRQSLLRDGGASINGTIRCLSP